MKKVATSAGFVCVHSYSTKDAKVYQGVHLFFSFQTTLISNKVKKNMLQNNIYR